MLIDILNIFHILVLDLITYNNAFLNPTQYVVLGKDQKTSMNKCGLYHRPIMGKSKQKQKSTREPQISSNSRADRKRAKQDDVHRMVVTSLESKTRGDFYGNVKKSSMMPLLLAHG